MTDSPIVKTPRRGFARLLERWRLAALLAFPVVFGTPSTLQLSRGVLLLADTALSPFRRTLLAAIGPLQIRGPIITAVGVLEQRGRGGGLWAVAIVAYVVLLVVGAVLGGVGGS